MRRILILLTSSYPYGEGEGTFVANEMPHLASAFDEIIVLTNDIVSEEARPLPGVVTCVRHPYELGTMEKMQSLLGLLSPTVWQEIRWIRTHYWRSVSGSILATALVSWFKAGKFARIIRRLAGAAWSYFAYVVSQPSVLPSSMKMNSTESLRRLGG